MSTLMFFSTLLITLALVFYSLGVWAERISRYLRAWHLVAFWTGLAFDVSGTFLMHLMAGGFFDLTKPHTLTGQIALWLMLVHATWATVVVRRGNEKARKGFHRYSIIVWLVWLIPYIGGMFMGMDSGGKTAKDDSVEMTTIGGEQVPIIHAERIATTEEVRFTDWVEDLKLVRLETSGECAIDYTMRIFVGREYILVSTVGKGILMFDQNGRFIRNLAPYGRGPGEVSDANRNIFVDEKNDRLYLTDLVRTTKRLISYDIRTGAFETIPIMHEGPEVSIRDIIVQEDSLMYITTMQVRGAKSDCPLFCQTTTGKLLWEVSKTHPLGMTESTILLVRDRIFFHYLFVQDTTWVLEGDQLRPVAILSTDSEKAYPEPKAGSVYAGLLPVGERLWFGSRVPVKEVEMDVRYGQLRPVLGEREAFTYNAKTGQARLIGEIRNDFFGSEAYFNPRFQPDGTVVASYQALDLLEVADSVSRLPDVAPEVKRRLEDIIKTVRVDDNPVLLIGRMKRGL
ncbi:MAG: HsmA family protein [Bacteroidales bacterium]